MLFVRYYILTKNATIAAKKAGFSEKTAHVQGCRLLKDAKINRLIQKGIRRQLKKADLTGQMIIDELRKIAFYDVGDAYTPKGELRHPQDMPEDIRVALKEVETVELFAGRGALKRKIGHAKKIKMADKVRSLELLAKHFKLLTDVSEVSGKDGGPQVVLHIFENGSEAPPETPPPPPETPGNDRS